MRKKKKINTTLILLLTTLVCLFGGQFIYHFHFIKKPLERAIESLPHVFLNDVTIQPKNVHVQLNTTQSFTLKEYPELRKRIQQIVGHRKIEIELLEKSDSHLQSVWDKMAFQIQESIAQKNYSQIPTFVNQIANRHDIKSLAFMDDHFIYIELHHQKHYLLRVYPVDKKALSD